MTQKPEWEAVAYVALGHELPRPLAGCAAETPPKAAAMSPTGAVARGLHTRHCHFPLIQTVAIIQTNFLRKSWAFMQPVTRYAKSSDVHVAYQVVGEGPRNLVIAPFFVFNIEVWWEYPDAARWLLCLASGGADQLRALLKSNSYRVTSSSFASLMCQL